MDVTLGSVRGGKLIGMTDFQRGLEQKRNKGEEGKDGRQTEGRDRQIFLI
jgi:hypothetical protein